jgi:23S rRNA (adenine2030-N6)-methyltransferase
MLSYQHGYHAGNLADVHKHALLASALAYLAAKDKPLFYMETHAGRGVYDLSDAMARKTGEAAQGIARALPWFAPDHPYARAIAATRAGQGASAYPGSPMIAAHLLRPDDHLHLAEAHPAEVAAMRAAMLPTQAVVHHGDGFALARAKLPPMPRRGMLLIDPSYETEDDYRGLPKFLADIARKWNVGVIALWYPILTDARHRTMTDALDALNLPRVLHHQVRFAPARPGHRMVGSGMFVVNAPFGLESAASFLSDRFAAIA